MFFLTRNGGAYRVLNVYGGASDVTDKGVRLIGKNANKLPRCRIITDEPSRLTKAN